MDRNKILVEIKQLLKQIMPNKVNIKNINFSTKLNSLGITSVAFAYIAYELAKKFHVSFNNSNFKQFKKINDIVEEIIKLHNA